MDQKINVQVDPNEDTEWNDILRSHGVIPQRPPSPTQQLEELINESVVKQHENRLVNKTLDELDELEDDEDEEFLQSYKQKRMEQISKLNEKSKFGRVFPVTKPEYKAEITDESNNCFVFVHLTLQSSLQSRLLSSLMLQLAPKFKEIKFVEIPGSRAIENYPDSNCPTIIIYHDTNVVKQLVTLTQLGGNSTTLADLEALLTSCGAVEAGDSRLLCNQADSDEDEDRKLKFVGKSIKSSHNDSDDDFFD